MEDLSNELLSYIFDFVPEDSLRLRKVCDEWDFVVTKYYNKYHICHFGTFKDIIEIFYRSKLNVYGETFINYTRYIHTFDLSFTYIEDVSCLGNVHTLIMMWCKNVRDFSSLINIHTLELSNTKIEDVSGLCNVHCLILVSCRKIKDVSFLGNVRTLILSHCKNIEDVSSLSNVYTLHLSSTKIKDVVSLCNVYFLDISFTNVEDVSALNNVHTLYLRGANTVDTSMLKSVNVFL